MSFFDKLVRKRVGDIPKVNKFFLFLYERQEVLVCTDRLAKTYMGIATDYDGKICEKFL